VSHIDCPECSKRTYGTPNECPYCGFVFSQSPSADSERTEDNRNINPNEASASSPSRSDGSQQSGTPKFEDTLEWRGETLTKDHAADLVGENHDWYWVHWREMSIKGSNISFNWVAGLLGPIWLGFRKMHIHALTLIAVFSSVHFLLTVLFLGQGVVKGDAIILGFLASGSISFLLMGLFGNYFYRSAVFKTLRVGRALHNQTSEQLRTYLRLKGGRNWAGGGAWLAVGLFSVFFSIAVTTQLKTSSGPIAGHTQSTYFVESRFKAPHVMEWLYHSNYKALLNQQDTEKSLTSIYVIKASKRLEQTCGRFLSSSNQAKRKTLDGIYSLYALGALLKSKSSQDVGRWFGKLGGIGQIVNMADADIDTFVRDQKTCNSKAVNALENGINRYFEKFK